MGRRPKPVTWNGVNYKSVTEAARAIGISASQMSQRVRRGLTCDEDCRIQGSYPVPIEERFWAKVSIKGDDDCWEWQASDRGTGYGQIAINRISTLAHRVAWELTNGPIPDGLLVLHKCDNRACVNPSHLFLGTHQDNVLDMIQKGRGNYKSGEDCDHSKLTWKQVRTARRQYANGEATQAELARRFDVSETTIYNVVHNLTWDEGDSA